MEKAKIKLNEIIWEITNRCDNNCAYCGSSGVTSQDAPVNIIRIASAIAEGKPRKVNISGGDPLQVDPDVLQKVVDILHGAGIQVTVLLNPKSLQKQPQFNLAMFDVLGLSVNTLEELTIAHTLSDIVQDRQWFNTHTTIVTNFNVTNVALVPSIAAFIKGVHKCWQVQYTMYKDATDPNALYNSGNSQSKELLEQLLSKAAEDVNIVLADNANGGGCSAGVSSLGILYNGDIVPCLSMRSWHPDLGATVQGNIFDASLKTFWEQRFVEYRFEDSICCKDHCGRDKVLKLTPAANNSTLLGYPWPVKRHPSQSGGVMAYAVISPRDARQPEYPLDQVIALYAVTTGDFSTYESVTTATRAKFNDE